MPHGVDGCLPPEVLPSPPPCGWSTGFIATPLTVGLTPRHLLAPAFPNERKLFSWLETVPRVALQADKIFLISPDCNLRVAYTPSLATNLAEVPALLAICAPLPGFISTQ